MHARAVGLVAVAAAGALCFAGCSFFVEEETAATGGEYNYVSSSSDFGTGDVPSATAPIPPETSSEQPDAASDLPSTLPSESSLPSLQPVQPTKPDVTEPPAIRPTVPVPVEPAATAQPTDPQPTAPQPPASEPVSEVDLSLELPEANGTMQVSRDPSNALIRAVHNSRGVDTSLLAAVYTVPANDQNYVFEFKTASKRGADDLRRVYLLNGDGVIQSVAAARNSERENLSVSENWFDFTVLIKGVIFPEIQDRLAN